MGTVVGDACQAELVNEFSGSPRTPWWSTRQARGHEHVLEPAELLNQLKLLEDEADVPQADAGERA